MKKLVLLSLCWASIVPAMELPKKELTQEQLEQQIVESIALQLIHEIHQANGLGDIEKNHLKIMALFASDQYVDALSSALKETFERLGIYWNWFVEPCPSNSLDQPNSLDQQFFSPPLASQIMVELALRDALSNPKIDKNNLLKKVASVGYVTWIKKLLKLNDVNINQTNTEGETVLHLAAKNGHLEVVKYLINHGADRGKQNMQGNRALCVALEKNHKKIADFILKTIPINKLNAKGETALHLAAKNGDRNEVAQLIADGANIEASEKSHLNTPLFEAAKNGHLEAVKCLVNNDADINKKNHFGATPFLLAAKNGHLEVVKCLVNNGADINAQNLHKDTALIWAAQKGHIKVVIYLINHGADLDKQNRMGEKALDVALEKKHTEIVKLLLEPAQAELPQSSRNE